MKSTLPFLTVVFSLKYLSAVVPSQAVTSLPLLKSLWHPNLYLAKDEQAQHYELRHTGTSYAASLSFLQTQQSLSDVMNCKCRFEAVGSAPGPGSFLQQKSEEVTENMQEETRAKQKSQSVDIPLSPRVDTEEQPSTAPVSPTTANYSPLSAPEAQPSPQQQFLYWPAPPSQIFQQMPLPQPQMFMYVPMMLPQSPYFPPASLSQPAAAAFLPRQ